MVCFCPVFLLINGAFDQVIIRLETTADGCWTSIFPIDEVTKSILRMAPSLHTAG